MIPIDINRKPWQNEQSLRIALDAMPVGVSWATLVDQNIVYTNRRFTEIFGYSTGDLGNISAWVEKYPILSERAMAALEVGPIPRSPR